MIALYPMEEEEEEVIDRLSECKQIPTRERERSGVPQVNHSLLGPNSGLIQLRKA